MDGDLDLDLAVNAYGFVRVYRNEGGKLVHYDSISGHGGDLYAIDWADFDGDGDDDLAVAPGNDYYTAHPIHIYADDGLELQSVWSSAERDFSLIASWGDFDADGYPDLAVGNSSLYGSNPQDRIYRNNGDGSLSLFWSSPSHSGTGALSWADYDSDGDLDLLADNELFEFDGVTFQEVWSTSSTWGSASGDLTGDGVPELVLLHPDGAALYELVDGTYTRTLDLNTGDANGSVDIGDYDGDGDADIAVASGADWDLQPVTLFENVSGSFVEAWTSIATMAGSDVAFGDLDGDGAAEVAVTDNSDVDFVVFNLADLDHDGTWDQCEDLFALPIRPAAPGQPTTFSARGATPGATVHMVVGTSPGATSIPDCSTSVGVSDPRVIGAGVADDDGFVSLQRVIPAAAAGARVHYQAVDGSTCEVGDLQSQSL